MNIIIDAFGGDNAPLEVIKGAIDAQKDFKIDITPDFATVALTTYKDLQTIKNNASDKTIIAEDGPDKNTVRYYF